MPSFQKHDILLDAHNTFISNGTAELIELLHLVEKTIPDAKSQERQAWTDHMGALCDVWQRRNEGEMVEWPTPPGVMPMKDLLSGDSAAKARVRERNERKARLEGAIGVGPARQSNASTIKGGPGRNRIDLLDELLIMAREPKADEPDKLQMVSYCVACDRRAVGRDFKRALEHGVLRCERLCLDWPNLYNRAAESLANRSSSRALETGNTKDLPKVRKTNEVAPLKQQGTVLEHFNTAKISAKQQAHIDLSLFKFFICCAIPFSVLDHQFFWNLLAALATNYVVPEWSTFFTRHIAEETVVLGNKLKEYLQGKAHLTLSFDGWSTRANDKIYTFHTTTPTRCSFFVHGHVFKGVSVTGQALLEVAGRILKDHGPRLYSAVAGDGGPNVRVGKREIQKQYPWILVIYDPCHNLNLLLKDTGKIFKELLTKVTAISNYFGKSNYGTYQLSEERYRLGISEGIVSALETRFSSSYLQARAVQACMPAIHACMDKKTLTFNTSAVRIWQNTICIEILTSSQDHYKFMGELLAFIQLLAPSANAILTLEGQAINCADVFYAWVCIAWHLEQLLGAPGCDLARYRSRVIEVYNYHFDQMMKESSYEIFLLGYWLHPMFHHNRGIQLNMPILNGQNLEKDRQPELYKQLLKAILCVLKGEQHIAIKVFSISPSEICDEHTASRLGWFNAARRSSMSPEKLIECTKLHDFYMHGFTDGNLDHKPHIYIPKVQPTGFPAEVPQVYSAPTLMDLINDENIHPSEVSKSHLESLWFEQLDPFNLNEPDCTDAESSGNLMIVRCSTHWKISDFIKLDSPLLAALIRCLSGDGDTDIIGAAVRATPVDKVATLGTPDDWDMDDYI
ncbi:hypothetical protein AN958_09777 [Leucoagaricus sp. SymC.cos]|nr:hypothetical protein AN958_09777 [Leucoagaricus sp. SymC.cos]